MLNAAYDAGIRHFDTAPLYGWGAGETVLGAFALGKSDLTIVTKVGLAPPTLAARLGAKIFGRTPTPRFNRFGLTQVRRSVEASLSRLRQEQVGALLLHEPAARSVTDDLLRVLEDLKASGKTAAIGLAGAPAEMAKILARYPQAFDIVQTPLAGIEHVAPHARGARLVIHSVLNPALSETIALLAADHERARRFEAETGIHHNDRQGVARLLLRAALTHVPDGVMLFSSSKGDRIRANAQLTPATMASAEGIFELTKRKRHARRA